uniref:Uncharacterized protein n=1 Tax=Steinernema glaseri TaxID=37863 RepID=A0A1I8AU63_9BILA
MRGRQYGTSASEGAAPDHRGNVLSCERFSSLKCFCLPDCLVPFAHTFQRPLPSDRTLIDDLSAGGGHPRRLRKPHGSRRRYGADGRGVLRIVAFGVRQLVNALFSRLFAQKMHFDGSALPMILGPAEALSNALETEGAQKRKKSIDERRNGRGTGE